MNVESVTQWELLRPAYGSELTDARLQLHWAAQIPAAAGNSWVPPEEDFAHLSLDWDRDTRTQSSHPSGTRPAFRVALEPEGLNLHVADEEGRARGRLPLQGVALPAALQWLTGVAQEITGEAVDAALKLPEHELPDHAVAQGASFDADPSQLAELARWFANAELLLTGLSSKVNHASAVRLWPHHYDIALLISLDPSETGDDARTIGVGMSPGDSSYAEPYWYVTPWPPPPEKHRLGWLEGGGVWHTEGWTGAVLPSSALIDTENAQEQAGQVLAFTQSAVNAGWAALDTEH